MLWWDMLAKKPRRFFAEGKKASFATLEYRARQFKQQLEERLGTRNGQSPLTCRNRE